MYHKRTKRAHGCIIMLPHEITYSESVDEIFSNLPAGALDRVVVMRCLSGKIHLKKDNTTVQVHEGQMCFLLTGTHVNEYAYSRDFKCRILAVSGEVINEISHLCMREDNLWWEKFEYLRQNPILNMQTRQIHKAETYEHFYELYADPAYHDADERVVKNIISSGVLEALSWVNAVMPAQLDTRKRSRVDIIFNRFVELMQSQNGKKRDVKWYAEQLAITPKYLTTICHQISGKSAGEILNNATVQELKQLLLHTDLSTKEICDQLEFITPSFFCKYVKRELGMSTKEFRRRYRQ